jgi:hypothetical protein
MSRSLTTRVFCLGVIRSREALECFDMEEAIGKVSEAAGANFARARTGAAM